jgi:hypothetical protein
VEGRPCDWGPNTFIKVGLDHRNWLVSSVEGSHPVGRNVRLPNAFHWECRYAAGMSEVTRGLLGWWKEPVSTKISFVGDQGLKYTVNWVVRCGNDPTRLNPIGSSSLCAKKYYHSITLPDGTTNEIGVAQPTGLLQIDRDKNNIRVLLDGQLVVLGTMSAIGPIVRFETEVVKAKNGTLFFTDFKVSR